MVSIHKPSHIPLLDPPPPPRLPTPPPNEIQKLSQPQVEALQSMKEAVQADTIRILNDTENLDLKKDLQNWEGESAMLRYLRANAFDPIPASRMYTDTLNWRQSFAPALITSASVEPEAVTGKCYVNGFDRNGRPVLYLRPARENTTSYERQVKYFVWVIERALKLMPEGVDRYVVIMDFDGYSLSNAPPMSTVIEIMKIFSNHYPERLAKLFLLNTSWLFSSLYKMVTPFIRASTQAKIAFLTIPRPPRVAKDNEQMWQQIDPEVLEQNAGGKKVWEYQHEVYWRGLLDKVGELPKE